MKLAIEITTKSPLHIGSGRADVKLDAEIIHDEYGLPYFPGKRLRGLLYESALEICEMQPLADKDFAQVGILQELFNHQADSPVTMSLHNFYLPEYNNLRLDISYLQDKYSEIIKPQDVLEYYTDIRFQTKIDPNSGCAADNSLRTLRVIDREVTFVGEIELHGASEAHQILLALALKNLRYAGGKRNRGFGKINCTLENKDQMSRLLAKAFGEE